MAYYNGTGGVQQDWVKALEQLTAAAHKGNSQAIGQLITMYSYGYGIPANPELAQHWSARYQRMGSNFSGMVVNGNTGVSVSTGDAKTFADVSTVGVVDATEGGTAGALNTSTVNINTSSFNGGSINGDAVSADSLNSGTVSVTGDAANSGNNVYSAD